MSTTERWQNYPTTPCKGSTCEARIVWALNAESGRPVPVDRNPVEEPGEALSGGAILYRLTRLGGKVHAERAWVVLDDEPLFQSHFQTCADPGKFSGRGGGR